MLHAALPALFFAKLQTHVRNTYTNFILWQPKLGQMSSNLTHFFFTICIRFKWSTHNFHHLQAAQKIFLQPLRQSDMARGKNALVFQNQGKMDKIAKFVKNFENCGNKWKNCEKLRRSISPYFPLFRGLWGHFHTTCVFFFA